MAQEKVLMSFPNLITVELPKDRLVTPFAGLIPQQIVKEVLDLTYRGVTHRDGSWRINPAEWKINKLGVGEYQIIHMLGYDNTSLSVSLLVQPGSFRIVEHGLLSFTVETLLDKVPTDLDFSFTLARVISQPVPPAVRSA